VRAQTVSGLGVVGARQPCSKAEVLTLVVGYISAGQIKALSSISLCIFNLFIVTPWSPLPLTKTGYSRS
jgi:hypothetical protein